MPRTWVFWEHRAFHAKSRKVPEETRQTDSVLGPRLGAKDDMEMSKTQSLKNFTTQLVEKTNMKPK